MKTPSDAVRACLLSVLVVGSLGAQQSAHPPPPEASQFDFWIGQWEVTVPNGNKAGENRIEAINGGRALLENWVSASGNYAGKSLNSYDATTGKWKQFWVDTAGLVLELSGGLVDGKMVLSGSRKDVKGADVQDRITWTPKKDGTVQQVWEHSPDGGKTWVIWFDGNYRRKPVQAE